MDSTNSGIARACSTEPPGQFPLTQWSAVSGAQKDGDSGVLEALNRLVRLYWKPLHAFAIGKGLDHHAAADAVQGFFGHVCSRQVLQGVERRETKFRTFLLTAFTNWLTDERRRLLAAKRGGNAAHERLPSSSGHSVPPGLTSEADPITDFDRSWARTLFDHAKERLHNEVAQGQPAQMAETAQEMVARLFSPAPDWEALALSTGQSHEAIRQRATRLRQRFSVLLRQQVRAVVSTEEEIADELRYILACLTAH